MDRKELLNRLAALTVKVGANVQKGQTVLLCAPVDCVEITRLIAQQCWLAGAGEVHIFYDDEVCDRLRYQHGTLARLTQTPQWRVDCRMNYPKGEACYIYIEGDDPDAFAGLDSVKIGKAKNATRSAMKPFNDMIDQNQNQWTIVPAATAPWATKVFPDMEAEAAVEKLWEAIAITMRLDTPDPVAAWERHSAAIAAHAKYLNESGITTLEFTSGLGTNLTVPLAEGYVWCGGLSSTTANVAFQANMPTEEVFTMPHKDKVSGRVVSALPLIYQGSKIENFSFTFVDGLVTDYTAEKGRDVLTQLLAGDAGCRRLGEVALVPYSSPIRQSGVLFLSTLFDENASCHLALGSAYPDTMAGGTEMTAEQRGAKGCNESINHVDFMFGTADLSVIGTTADGKKIPVFVKGEFAF